MLLTRRSLIKSASASLLAAPAIIKPASAWSSRHVPLPSDIDLPAFVSDQTINKKPFWFNDLTSLDKVDVNNTLQPGKDLYLYNWAWPVGFSSNLLPSDITSTGTSMRVQAPHERSNAIQFSTAGYLGHGKWIQGPPTVAGSRSFYITLEHKFQQGGRVLLPATWLYDIEMSSAYNLQSEGVDPITYRRSMEWDIIEANHVGPGNTGILNGLTQSCLGWGGDTPGAFILFDAGFTLIPIDMTNWDYSIFHQFGVDWCITNPVTCEGFMRFIVDGQQSGDIHPLAGPNYAHRYDHYLLNFGAGDDQICETRKIRFYQNRDGLI